MRHFPNTSQTPCDTAPVSGPSPVPRPLAGGSRRGLTLVELMVTITIIAILATLFLGALVNAQNDAKAMKTKSMIVKLNNLIMPRYESYRTRRVPMQIQGTAAGANVTRFVAQDRLNALHDLMRLEMPDRWTDVLDGPITFTWYNPTNSTTPNSTVPISRPALNQAYLNTYLSIVNNPANPQPINSTTLLPTNSTYSSALFNYEGAECLYMIVTLGFVDELGGRDLFNESSIGDVDQDGFPEFQDAWGTPIRFLRWAPGFTDSEIQGAGGIQIVGGGTSLTAFGLTTQFHSHGLSSQNNAYAGRTITVYTPTTGLSQSATIASSSYLATSGETILTLASPGLVQTLHGNETFGIDPDPFDPLRCYPFGAAAAYGATNDVPFALYPLIFSAGPNKTFGILTDFANPAPLHYSYHSCYPFIANTASGPSAGQMVGTMTDLTGEQASVPTWEPHGWLDNIHNHLIGLR